MKSTLCLAAAVSALLVCMSAAHAQSNDRYVVIDNMNAVTGQANVGTKVAIPIEGTAQFADPDGNIRVQCKKGTHGDSTTCSNIGAGGSALPIAPVVTLTAPTSPVTANGAKISWGSTGADVCYGLSAQGSTGAPAVTGWTKEWTKAGGNGFALDSLLAGMDAGTSATYDFVLRCYSTPTGTIGQTKIVAYTDKTATVTLNKSAGQPPAGDWCDAYKASLSSAELAHFNEYNAENRGFTAIQHDFASYTGKTPGISPNGPVSVGPQRITYLPGKHLPNEYYAFSLSLPEQSGGQYLKFALTFNYKNGFAGVLNHNVIATLSPCRGDFRPQEKYAETYLSPFCRIKYGNDGVMIQASSDPNSYRCPVPAGAKMYLNMSVRDLSDLTSLSTDTNYGPYSNCTTALYCGKGTDVSPN